MPGINAEGRCLSPGFFVIRFGRGSDTLTGMATGLKEPVYVQVGLGGGTRGM